MSNWTTSIDSITEQTISCFETLTKDQINWMPDAQTWSIAQNLDHLIVVNETYFPVLASLKDGNYKIPVIAKVGFIVSFFGKIVLKAVQPNRQKKMKTFPIWEPRSSHFEGDVLKRFENHQKELKQKMNDANELIAKGTIISSPANRNIVYKLSTAFDIIVSHELRHLEQAKEVLVLIKSTSGH